MQIQQLLILNCKTSISFKLHYTQAVILEYLHGQFGSKDQISIWKAMESSKHDWRSGVLVTSLISLTESRSSVLGNENKY